ncbi:hypothetical protein BHE74_00057830 [Ensete ventricosum]|nr:hypothetical protein BHE74_00057830 [Ensete ventricosum]
MRKNCWADGVLGTNCPIPPGWNWTYDFQVKDQIGSFFYFPSLGLQRAAGGYGGIIVNSRDVVPVPFAKPDGDINLFIGDWYIKNHTDLRKMLDDGKDLGMPDGVLMNGKGPYRYNSTLVPDALLMLIYTSTFPLFSLATGKTYRFRIHNVGISTSLNFRIQNHNLLLVEAEGTHTLQQEYANLDIHVGQSYSFLVTMDQNASSDYYIVASARFVNESLWTRVTGVAVLHYSNSGGKASGPLPDPPNDFYYKGFSMNQARSIRMDYGEWTEDCRDTYNKWDALYRSTTQVSIYLSIYDDLFIIVFPFINSSVACKIFFALIIYGMMVSSGIFSLYILVHFLHEISGDNILDVDQHVHNIYIYIFKSSSQVFPGAWTAVYVSLDNVGIWNVRAENLDTWYLGQEAYMRIVNPERTNKTELPVPDNVLYCGLLQYLQKPQAHKHSSASSVSNRGNLLAWILLLASLAMVP